MGCGVGKFAMKKMFIRIHGKKPGTGFKLTLAYRRLSQKAQSPTSD
jgi:hypothetical protein